MTNLTNQIPTAQFTVWQNNEEVSLYPDADGGEFGVIKHEYEGLPAQVVVLYDVVGWEVVEYDFEPEEGKTMDEEFDFFESEIKEWIGEVLFETGISSAEGDLEYADLHTIRVTNPWEGDSYTVQLQTDNKRRIR